LEIEWEYACVANAPELAYSEDPDKGWHARNSGRETKPVGLKDPNPFGLFDMHGNVFEWCIELGSVSILMYDQKEEQCRSQFIRHTFQPIYRGGAWNSFPEHLNPSTRLLRGGALARIPILGFRVGRTL
jgi:formylglycine-generating enzyme required for sulfatase activity